MFHFSRWLTSQHDRVRVSFLARYKKNLLLFPCCHLIAGQPLFAKAWVAWLLLLHHVLLIWDGLTLSYSFDRWHFLAFVFPLEFLLHPWSSRTCRPRIPAAPQPKRRSAPQQGHVKPQEFCNGHCCSRWLTDPFECYYRCLSAFSSILSRLIVKDPMTM